MPAPTITPLPTPPSRGDAPETFNAEADAFLGALPTLQSEVNAVATWIDTTANTVGENAASSQAWAEGTEPGGPGTKSAKGWAENAADAEARMTADLELLSDTEVIGRTAPVTGTTLAAGTYVYANPAVHDGHIVVARGYNPQGTSGTVKIKVFSKSGDTFTQVGADVDVTAASGSWSGDLSLAIAAGQYVGFYTDATSRVTYNGGTADNGGYYNTTGNSSGFTDASVQTGIRLEFGVDIQYLSVTETRIAAIETDVATKADAADVAYLDDLDAVEVVAGSQTIGRAVDPVAGSNLGGATYVYATALSNASFLRRIRVYNAGAETTLAFKAFTKSGDTFTQDGSDVSITIPPGLSTLRVGKDFARINVAAGRYPGFYVISNRLQYTSATGDSGGYYDSGSGNSSGFTDASVQTVFRLEIGFDFSYTAVTGTEVAADIADLQSQIDSITTGNEPRLFRWARGYRTPLPLPTVMSSPPTITIGTSNAVSAITGAANGTLNVARTDTRLTYAGGAQSASGTAGFDWWGGGWRGGKLRFKHTGRRFEVRVRSLYGFGFDVYVDGQLNTRNPFPAGLTQTGNHLVLVDFGADTSVFYAARATVSSGGSGYAVGDQITLSGGTSTTAAVVQVVAVSGGAITSAYVRTAGSYTAVPSNPVSQASTTGTGTGATFSMTWNRTRSTIKERSIELVFGNNVYFGGLNIDTNDTLTAWPVPAGAPMLQVRSDSFGDNAITDYESGNLFDVMCQELGLFERRERVATGGRGYLAGSPVSSIAVAANARVPDVILYGLGVNDELTAQSSSGVQAEVTARINADHAANADALVVVMTGWQQNTTYRNAIINGVLAATDQTRVRYIDLQASSMYVAASTAIPLVSTDNLHPHQEGHTAIGQAIAPLVHAAIREMAA